MTSGRGRRSARAYTRPRCSIARTIGGSCGPGDSRSGSPSGSPCSSCSSRLRRRPRDGFALAAWIAVLLLFGAAFWRATARRAAAERLGCPAARRGRGRRRLRARRAASVLRPGGRAARARRVPARAHPAAAGRERPGSPRRAPVCSGSCGSTGDGTGASFSPSPTCRSSSSPTPRPASSPRRPRSRHGLAAANAELEATRELLAQSVRLAERARIARDLHDLLGHHLTALSLNLEIASHKADGEARERIDTAQSVTKLLLGDVRGVVGALRGRTASTFRPRSASSPTAFPGRASMSTPRRLSRSTIRPSARSCCAAPRRS